MAAKGSKGSSAIQGAVLDGADIPKIIAGCILGHATINQEMMNKLTGPAPAAALSNKPAAAAPKAGAKGPAIPTINSTMLHGPKGPRDGE